MVVERRKIQHLLEDYSDSPVIGAVASHSALDVFDGAVSEGFGTFAICQKGRERTYTHYFRTQRDPAGLPLRGCVDDALVLDKFSELIDIGFTAKMEEELDEIENAKLKWVKVVKKFYTPLSRDLKEASKDTGKVKPQDIPTDEVCEKCGSPMVIKWGRHGRFLACSGYPQCKNARPIEGEQQQRPEPVATGEVCEKCGSPMVIKSGRFGKFLACSKYPECKNTKPISTGVKCPVDGGDIVERKSKRGKSFWSCSNYPNCKFALWFKPVPRQCPKCNAPFLVEKWNKAGDRFLACINKACNYSEEMKEESTPAREA